jgi:S-adenosylmethionine uptake transporter
VTLFHTGLYGFLFATVGIMAIPPEPAVTPEGWSTAGFVGAGTLAAHGLLVAAFRRAQASDLAPFGYLGILWAFLIGAAAFAETVEPHTVLGALGIGLGGVIAARGVAAESRDGALAVQPGSAVVATDDEASERGGIHGPEGAVDGR